MINDHGYKNTIIIKDSFFEEPEKVLKLAESLEDAEFQKHPRYPGWRSRNLLELGGDYKNFAQFFAASLIQNCFPKIQSLKLELHFHRNKIFSDDREDMMNEGWVHSDNSFLAGLVYLNKDYRDLDNGTGIFEYNRSLYPDMAELQELHKLRRDFNENEDSMSKEEYKNYLMHNNSQYDMSVVVGNKFNRLVAYDSKMPHAPLNYYLTNKEMRFSLLFFINNYTCFYDNSK